MYFAKKQLDCTLVTWQETNARRGDDAQNLRARLSAHLCLSELQAKSAASTVWHVVRLNIVAITYFRQLGDSPMSYETSFSPASGQPHGNRVIHDAGSFHAAANAWCRNINQLKAESGGVARFVDCLDGSWMTYTMAEGGAIEEANIENAYAHSEFRQMVLVTLAGFERRQADAIRKGKEIPAHYPCKMRVVPAVSYKRRRRKRLIDVPDVTYETSIVRDVSVGLELGFGDVFPGLEFGYGDDVMRHDDIRDAFKVWHRGIGQLVPGAGGKAVWKDLLDGASISRIEGPEGSHVVANLEGMHPHSEFRDIVRMYLADFKKAHAAAEKTGAPLPRHVPLRMTVTPATEYEKCNSV